MSYELVRTNDVAAISAIEDLLQEGEIPHLVADREMSVIDGSINAIQVRVLVPDDKAEEARELLRDGGLGHWLR